MKGWLLVMLTQGGPEAEEEEGCFGDAFTSPLTITLLPAPSAAGVVECESLDGLETTINQVKCYNLQESKDFPISSLIPLTCLSLESYRLPQRRPKNPFD